MGKRNRMDTARAFVLGMSGLLVLTGCASTSTPGGPSSAPSETTQDPPATSMPITTPAPISLPTCDDMNATALQQYLDYGPEVFSVPAGETDRATFDELAGTNAQAAMDAAAQTRGCQWPVHMEGMVTQYVSELDAAQQGPLIDALRDDPDATEASVGDAATFTYVIQAPSLAMANTQATHIFLGDTWTVIFDRAGQRDYVQAAIDGLLRANPALADSAPEDGDAEASDAGQCSGLTGSAALAKWAPEAEGSMPWDLTGQFSDTSGYDDCAALSWVQLRPESCCTRFSVTPLLLFHDGVFVPPTTGDYAVESVQRISDGEISVTYMWQGEDIAGPAKTATSVYAWDEASASITRTGELPPM